jgi:glyoxylase-like metal-dependent hydrolase (beta-lactamase superfamily II)
VRPEFIAQENCKASMEKMPAFQTEEGKKFLPGKTFKDKLSVLSGSEKIDLYYFGRGHTNGDAWIVFPELRLVHAGDIFSGKNLPLLDMNNGGSGVDIGDTLAKAHAGIKNVDTIITGHSTLMTWNDLAEYAQFNKDFLRDVRAAATAGKAADDVAGTWKAADKYKGYTVAEARLKTNVQAVYKEIGK